MIRIGKGGMLGESRRMVMNEYASGLWTGTALVKFYMVGSPPEPTLPGDSLYYASRLRAGNRNPPYQATTQQGWRER